MARSPDGPAPPPVVQRLRVRYAKRGRMRFTSHRDFARAFERALRRANAPVAYSAGFTPHPKISYVGAAPTGVASEAEYLEVGLAAQVDPEQLRAALDAVLPDGLDVVEVVPAGPGSLAERMQASVWRLELPGVSSEEAEHALAAFWACGDLAVERVTKTGRRSVDVRGAVLRAELAGGASDGSAGTRAIINLVVRQVTPVVRPDDVVTALHTVAGLAPAAPPLAVRQAQGPLVDHAEVGDPLAADREHVAPAT